MLMSFFIFFQSIYFLLDFNYLYSLPTRFNNRFKINDEYFNSRRLKTSLRKLLLLHLIIMKPPIEGYSTGTNVVSRTLYKSHYNDFFFLSATSVDGVKTFIYGDKNSTVSTVFKPFIIYTRHWHIRSIPINSFPIEKVSTEKCKLCLNLFLNEIWNVWKNHNSKRLIEIFFVISVNRQI